MLALLDTHRKPSCLKRGFTTSWTPLEKMQKREGEVKLCSLKRSDTQLQHEGKHLPPLMRYHQTFPSAWCLSQIGWWNESRSYWSHTLACSHSPWPNEYSGMLRLKHTLNMTKKSLLCPALSCLWASPLVWHQTDQQPQDLGDSTQGCWQKGEHTGILHSHKC